MFEQKSKSENLNVHQHRRQQLSAGSSSTFISIPEIKATVYEYIPEQTKIPHMICDLPNHNVISCNLHSKTMKCSLTKCPDNMLHPI